MAKKKVKKTTRMMRNISRIMAVTMAVAPLVAVVPEAASASAPSATPGEITFTDINSTPGFLEGTVSINANGDSNSEDYSLFWADETGAKIGTVIFNVYGSAGYSGGTYTFSSPVSIPPEATQFIAFSKNSSGEESLNHATLTFIDAAPPQHNPSALEFTDLNVYVNEIQGTVSFTPAENESDITAYALYWADDVNEAVYTNSNDPLAVVAKNDSNSFTIPPNTPIPNNATQFMLVSQNSFGLSNNPIFVAIQDDTSFFNSAPDLNSGIPDQYAFAYPCGSIQLNLADYFTDVDSDSLSYSVTSSDGDIVHADLLGSLLQMKYVGSGTSLITVNVDDGHNHTTTTTFDVIVNPAASISSVSIPYEHYLVGDNIVMTVEADKSVYTAQSVAVTINGLDISNTLEYIGNNKYVFTYAVTHEVTDLLAGDSLPYYVKFSKNAVGSDVVSTGNPIISSPDLSIDGSGEIPETRDLYPSNNNIENKDHELTMDFGYNDVDVVSGGTITIYRYNDDHLIAAIPVDSERVEQRDGDGIRFFSINVSNLLDYNTKYYVKVNKGAFINSTGNKYQGLINKNDWVFTTGEATATFLSRSLAFDNSYVDVTIGDLVYGNVGLTAPVLAEQLEVHLTNESQEGATDVSIVRISKPNGDDLEGGETVIRVYLDIVGTPTSVETLHIAPKKYSKNEMDENYTTSLYTFHSGQFNPFESISVSLNQQTEAPIVQNISISDDTVEVTNVIPFGEIKIYDSLTGAIPLVIEISDQETSGTLTLNLPEGYSSSHHYFYVTQKSQYTDVFESKRTKVAIPFQLSATASDDIAEMALWNLTIGANNKWTINVSNAMVKEDMSKEDLSVSDLPDGLSLTAVKGIGNTIVITVTGTATTAVESTANVYIAINGSAVTEEGAYSSDSLSLQLNPTTFQVMSSGADASIDLLSGNQEISEVNNTWKINVSSATVRENVSESDLIVTDLPEGLSLYAAKGNDNSIIITVEGTTTSTVANVIDVHVVVKGSAVIESGATNATSLSLQLNPFFFQLTSNGSDASIDMAAGNKTINLSNNTWTINGLNGTVKEGLSAADLTVTGLPSGLILSAAKGPDNKIVITVTGTATAAVASTTNVNVVVKGSAVTENGATNSTSLSLQLNPLNEVVTNYTITNATAIALDLNNLIATATISRNVEHAGKEYIVFELVDNTAHQSVGILSHDLDVDTETGVKLVTTHFNETTLNSSHSYSIKVYVASSFNGNVIGTNLALIKTIPVTTFSQLNILGNDTVIGIDDIIAILTGSTSEIMAIQDINHDGQFKQADDIKILLDQIPTIIIPLD